jgi:hypothetical protein
MWWLLWVGLAVVCLFGLHRLARWAEARGWIYYRTKHMPPGVAGMAFLEATSILNPQVTHVVEEVRGRQARAEQDESGDGGPESGGYSGD